MNIAGILNPNNAFPSTISPSNKSTLPRFGMQRTRAGSPSIAPSISSIRSTTADRASFQSHSSAELLPDTSSLRSISSNEGLLRRSSAELLPNISSQVSIASSRESDTIPLLGSFYTPRTYMTSDLEPRTNTSSPVSDTPSSYPHDLSGYTQLKKSLPNNISSLMTRLSEVEKEISNQDRKLLKLRAQSLALFGEAKKAKMVEITDANHHRLDLLDEKRQINEHHLVIARNREIDRAMAAIPSSSVYSYMVF